MEERREELPRERREELARERTEEALPPHFHTKTASMSGSVDSEAGSDSSLSLPSSSAQGKARDGSEADSERDSVSPQRSHEEVRHCSMFTVITISPPILLFCLLEEGTDQPYV